jgi:hypothetical protein
MPGRNDPCPCGSGKKYKKCCLEKEAARAARTAPSPPPVFEKRPAPQPRTPKARPPEPPPDPRRAAFDRFWEDFESRDYEGRMATFRGVLDDDELMDSELAIEMLLEIQGEALKRGEWERLGGLIEALRERRPEAYEAKAVSYLSWIISGALAAGQFEAVRPLALELGQRAGDNIDIFNGTFDQLAYHGHLDTLVEMLRLGWPGVKASSDIIPWGITEFAAHGARYETFHYLEHTADPHGDDPGLLERTRFFVEDPNTEYVALVVETLAGRNVRTWSVDDFKMQARRKRRDWEEDEEDEDEDEEQPDPGVRNLAQLTLEFLRYLRHEEGVPYPKGELARKELIDYFVRRHHGDLEPRGSMYEEVVLHKRPPKAPKPEHPLCPERVTLDVHLGGLMGFLNGLYYRGAATFEVIPAWLRFLQTRGLIDAERRRRTVQQLMPVQADLLKCWENSAESAVLYRAAQAWPEDAAREPQGE